MPSCSIKGRSAWYGPGINKSQNWLRTFSNEEKLELEVAMRSVKKRNLNIVKIQKKDFHLPTLSLHFESIRKELLFGRGFTLLRGLSVEDYSIKELAIIYCGIGTHFGLPLPQNAKGHILGHIKDVGLNHSDHNVRIYQTRARQTYHTDSCDFVFLLCLRPAMKGGLSSIVSSVTIYNEILHRRPDLLNVLFQPIETDRRGEVPSGMRGYYRMPIFNWFKGKLSTLYTRRYIESARRFNEVAKLTNSQREALDFFDQLANNPDLNLNMEFKSGDIQILHNHQILHDRTAYEDWPEDDSKRHLLRLWISPPDGRPLPKTFIERYGSIETGSIMRGGVRVPRQIPTAPLEPE